MSDVLDLTKVQYQESKSAIFNLLHLMAYKTNYWNSTAYQKIYVLPIWQKKVDIILIPSHHMAIVVLAIVIFLFDNVRDQRSVPLTK